MSKATGIPDWICMEHSSAGYLGDGGCTACANVVAQIQHGIDMERDLTEARAEIERLNKMLTDTPYINPSGKIRNLLSCAVNQGLWGLVCEALTVLDTCTEHDDRRLAEKDEEIERLKGTIDRLQAKLEKDFTKWVNE